MFEEAYRVYKEAAVGGAPASASAGAGIGV
jgi:hypothetical protein